MAQKTSPAKSKKKRSSHRTVGANRVAPPVSLTNEVPAQSGVDEERSGYGPISLLPILLWFLGLSAGLIIVGLLVQDIPQPLDTIRWLIYRRGYPYFQAITLSMLVVTASIVISSAVNRLVKIDQLYWVVRFILQLLLTISSGYRSNRWWKTFFFVSLSLFIASLRLPMCLSSDAILVSFDIFDNGSLVKNVSPGETVFYAPARYVEIEAKLETNLFNLAPPRVTCAWATYTGDGRLIQGTNCKINYQTGSDDRSDPVVVNITQNGCPSSGYHSFFLSKAE